MASAGQSSKARSRAVPLYPRSAPMRGAYVKGAVAALDGKSVLSCPYSSQGNTWAGAFRRAWLRGFRSEGGQE